MSKICVDCGKPVEERRECYVIPTCYACLPPPPPLPIVHIEIPEEPDINCPECDRPEHSCNCGYLAGQERGLW